MTASLRGARPWDGRCWCQTTVAPTPFAAGYVRCAACETLVSTIAPATSPAGVVDDATDFYGAQYWTNYQADAHGLPSLAERSRSDVSERCVYWLRTLLAYRRPPARLLEIGASHGGFLRLAGLAGFEGTGIEMSPSIVEYARSTFGVDMRVGPVEVAGFADGAFDVAVVFDVLEHFQDPAGTLRELRRVLRPDGVLLIQTPEFPARAAHELIAANDAFLVHLCAPEHLYLFSAPSLETILARTGFPHAAFVPAIFPYDMFAIASAHALGAVTAGDVALALSTTADGRLALALLDLFERAQRLDVVAAERLQVIDGLKQACDERLAVIERLDRELTKHR